jgi:DNA polymerase-3 subunit alpha
MSKTELSDRTLYYDGDSVVSPNQVVELIDKGFKDLYVTELTEEIKQYNRLSPKKITTKEEVKPLSFEWNIPEPYKSLDVWEHVHTIFYDEMTPPWKEESWTSEETLTRQKRLKQELHLYEDLGLMPILRAITYVINTLQDKNIVWGVGRGSSVSSYVLYILGVHDVDSVKYNLDIADFLRAPEEK